MPPLVKLGLGLLGDLGRFGRMSREDCRCGAFAHPAQDKRENRQWTRTAWNWLPDEPAR